MQLLKKSLFSFLALAACTTSMPNRSHIVPLQTKIVVLQPAGSALYPGREIGDHFERGLTLQLAEQIKKEIEERMPQAVVIIMNDYKKKSSETHYANKVGADLVVALHLYQETTARPRCFIWYYQDNPFLTPMDENTLALVPTHKAYRIALKKTKQAVHAVESSLQKYPHLFLTACPTGIPCMPLQGVAVPAFSLEAGIKTAEWKNFVIPFACAITNALGGA